MEVVAPFVELAAETLSRILDVIYYITVPAWERRG